MHMKYRNAKDVLPKELLREVKKYASGLLLYVPSEEADRLDAQMKRPLTEFRQSILIRNQRIYNEYLSGKSVSELAEQYYLSLDTVKKMVYGKKNDRIPFDCSLETAAKYAANGLKEEWVRTYLIRKTKNANAYQDEWKVDGLLRFPLRLIDATEVPPNEIGNGEPFIIRYAQHRFTLRGSEETLTRMKEKMLFSAPAFVILEDEKDFSFYYENYGKPFGNGKMYDV